jgi:hypothetical protein
MATVTGTVNISFTANSEGNHRICYLVRDASTSSSNAEYNCTTVVNCESGNACATSFDVELENDTCTTSWVIEGYVQPECYDEDSENGRVDFEETFSPDPDCKSFYVVSTVGTFASATIVDAGSGITPTGSGFTPTTNPDNQLNLSVDDVTIGTGNIISVAIGSGGTGYQVGDTFNVTDSVGSGAGGILTVATVDGSGVIETLTITAGDLYESPVVSEDTVNGSAASLTALSDYGTVVSVTLSSTNEAYIAPGSSYNGTWSFDGAEVQITMQSITNLVVTTCAGATQDYGSFELGTGMYICSTETDIATDLDTGLDDDYYQYTQDGCCVGNTINYTLTNSDDSNDIDMIYTQQDGIVVEYSLLAGTSVEICAVVGTVKTVAYTDSDTVTIEAGDECI